MSGKITGKLLSCRNCPVWVGLSNETGYPHRHHAVTNDVIDNPGLGVHSLKDCREEPFE
jgi:hypothetical protein